MAKKYYGEYLLPDIDAVWDKTAYPYAYISVCDCAAPIGGIVTGTGKYAQLVTLDAAGYIRLSETGYDNTYVGHAAFTAETFMIAMDDDAAESLQTVLPGINRETWLAWDNTYQTEAAAGAGPHWTNTALYSESGSLFLAASVPVAQFSIRSWLTGYVLGLCGKPLRCLNAAPAVPLLADAGGHILMDAAGLRLIPKEEENSG